MHGRGWQQQLATLLMLLLTLFGAVEPGGAEMQSAPPVRSACEDDYPPFCSIDELGRPSGFSVELLRAALQAVGRETLFTSGTWLEIRAMLEEGRVQVLPLVDRTPEREALYDFTFPYLSLQGTIVVRNDTPSIHSFADLNGHDVAVLKGDSADEYLQNSFTNIHVYHTASFLDALRQLSEGQHDAVVIQRLLAMRLIQQAGLHNLRILKPGGTGFSQSFCFAVKEGDKDLLALLNEGLALITADGTARHLYAKWFSSLELPANRHIIIGGDHNFPPYEFLDENGEPTGFTVDLTRALAKAMDLDIEIRLGPWEEMLQQLSHGKIDALQGILYSAERDYQYTFTPPHSANSYVGVTRKGTLPPPKHFDELTNKSIVVQAGDFMHSALIEQGLTNQLTAVADQQTALEQLVAGNYDCAIVSRRSAMYWVQKNNWHTLRIAQHPMATLDYCYAVAPDNKALAGMLSDGLSTLNDSGEYKRIFDKWMGGYEVWKPSLRTILTYTAFIAIPLGLALALALAGIALLRRQVRRGTAELRTSEEKFRALYENAPIPYQSLNSDGCIRDVNPAWCHTLGYKREDVLGKWFGDFLNDSSVDAFNVNFPAFKKRGYVNGVEFDMKHCGGAVRTVSFRGCIGYTPKGQFKQTYCVFQDITGQRAAELERSKLQEELIQSQKLESVGRLAGGVAHDFNNLLMGIMGYTDLCLDEIPEEHPIRHWLEEIARTSRRSANLTRQLLAFARKQTIAPKVIDLNDAITGILGMLQPLIGENIDISWIPGRDLWPIKMDSSQIDQLLANLAVNARDAISGVGKLTIETHNATFDEQYCSLHADTVAGHFVMLAVSDTGNGMDKTTLEHLFEPFYTTKKTGNGTGLGLSTVYGIIKQNKGFIHVYSELEQGTTFKIYLPRFDGVVPSVTSPAAPRPSPGGSETILLVEDEPAIRTTTRLLLSAMGYTVLAAESPGEALQLVQAYTDTIHLLITDVIMPGMNGRELADKLLANRPQMHCLFMSGYTANVIADHGVLDEGIAFLNKPFNRNELANKVREVLT